MLSCAKAKPFSFLFVSIICVHTALSSTTRSPKIAVVGGGIGGTSAAYFLRELLGSVRIDLYEANKIGGRIATITINNDEYEAGGAIIHPRNKYMVDFLNLAEKQKRKNIFSTFGMYDGKEFIFTDSDWEYFTLAKLLWRYGYGPIKLNRYIQDMLTSFSRIYTLQANMQCFTTVAEMLRAMDPRFVDDLKISTKKGLTKEGISEKVIDELVMATLTANYGQNLDVHKFVGLVSVAGADGALWAVEGGNKGIPEKLLEISKAKLIHGRVTKVSHDSASGGYTLQYKETSTKATRSNDYDIVIMATPLTIDMTDVEFDLPINVTFLGRYHRTVCTIIEGTIDYRYFGFEKKNDMIDEILTVNLKNFYNSVGRVNPVKTGKKTGKKSNIWKIFSQGLLLEEDLKNMFSVIKSVHVADWLAYPHYSTAVRNDSFVLYKNLFHINAIEWAASAMEMSVIGAKNTALLAYKTWYGLEYQNPSELFKDEF